MRNAQADAIKDEIITVFSRLSSENARNVTAPSEAAGVQPATRNQVLYISFYASNTCTGSSRDEALLFRPRKVRRFHEISPRFVRCVRRPNFLNRPHRNRPSRNIR